jgi:hypothetical protein
MIRADIYFAFDYLHQKKIVDRLRFSALITAKTLFSADYIYANWLAAVCMLHNMSSHENYCLAFDSFATRVYLCASKYVAHNMRNIKLHCSPRERVQRSKALNILQ